VRLQAGLHFIVILPDTSCSIDREPFESKNRNETPMMKLSLLCHPVDFGKLIKDQFSREIKQKEKPKLT